MPERTPQSPDKVKPPRELSFLAICLGIAIAVVFGAANAALALRVGMTVSASIPAAVISMAVLRALRRPNALLENNMVQTIGSSGEGLAAGVVFTIPAFILLDLSFSLFQTFLFAMLGGFLGILMMIPLRRLLIVEEHKTLPYPEGTACAEVLKAGEHGGLRARTVFQGVGLGAVYKFLADGLKLFPSTIESGLPVYRGAAIGMDALPSLLGVGYIIGIRIAAVIFAGGVLGWLVFIPAIREFGSRLSQPLYPATKLISEMSAGDIWSNYIRYIGAGGVAIGGLVSLLRSMPTISRSIRTMFLRSSSRVRGGSAVPPHERDMDLRIVAGGVVALIVIMAVLPTIPVGILGAVLIAVFGFFFVAVASRIVGIVGGSSCPISGMTIAALLVCAAILKEAGYSGKPGMAAALSIGAILCIAISMAADTSQDLKTGFLVKATPWRQQVGELIAILPSAVVAGLVVMMLHKAYGIGKGLEAPQATIMSLVVRGVMEANLPWNLVLIGMATALVVELLGVRSLPFSIGLYLKIHLSAPIIVGGILHWLLVGRRSRGSPAGIETTPGVLFASGLIAGDATMLVILAGFEYTKVSLALEGLERVPQAITLLPFLVLAFFLARTDWRREGSPTASSDSGR